jgi:hypothetical protein
MKARAARKRGDVFVREVNVRFDVSQDFHQVVAQLVDAPGELAGQLFAGGGERQFGAGVDEVGHGFGLGEVQTAIEEGAPCELAGSGEASAIFEEGFQDKAGREQAAMTTDFHSVLAGEGARGAKDREQYLIHVLAVADYFPEMNGVGGGGGRRKGGFAGGPETGFGDGKGAGAGKADYGETAFAQRRGDGGDCVVKHNVPGVKRA